MGTKTTSSTKVEVPPPTEDEKRAKALSNLVNEQNLRDAGYDIIDEGGALSLRPRALTPEQQEQKDFDTQLQKQIRQRLFGGPVDEETRKLVDETFGATRELGNEEIARFMREQAGARGLDLATDTPALKELGLAKSRLETGLGGARSAALLDQGNRQQLFAASLNEFQQNLKQQAFLNRSMIGESYAQTGLGLSRERFGQATQRNSQSTSGPGTWIGPLAQAGAAAASAYMMSSRDFKDDIEVADIDAILDEIESTPVYTWRYKPEFADGRRHIGPVTEESPPQIVSDDGKALVGQDMLGFMFAALKALSAKVKQLEQNANGAVR